MIIRECEKHQQRNLRVTELSRRIKSQEPVGSGPPRNNGNDKAQRPVTGCHGIIIFSTLTLVEIQP